MKIRFLLLFVFCQIALADIPAKWFDHLKVKKLVHPAKTIDLKGQPAVLLSQLIENALARAALYYPQEESKQDVNNTVSTRGTFLIFTAYQEGRIIDFLYHFRLEFKEILSSNFIEKEDTEFLRPVASELDKRLGNFECSLFEEERRCIIELDPVYTFEIDWTLANTQTTN